jgi:hypothetical protein
MANTGTVNQDSTAQRDAIIAGRGPGETLRVVLAHNADPIAESGPVRIGLRHQIELPDRATQRAGFALPKVQAKILVAQYHNQYKILLTDGSRQAAHYEQSVGHFDRTHAAFDALTAGLAQVQAPAEGGEQDGDT